MPGLLLLLLLVLAPDLPSSVIADESFDVRLHLSTVSSYDVVKDILDDPLSPSEIPDGCKPIHLNLLVGWSLPQHTPPSVPAHNQLSTKLVDVNSAIARMRAPLTDLRDKIVTFRDSVDSSLVSLQNGLRQRAEAANFKEVLELLLDTFHVVSKVEKLIKELPWIPTDLSNGDANAAEQGYAINGLSSQHAENGSNVQETHSILQLRMKALFAPSTFQGTTSIKSRLESKIKN